MQNKLADHTARHRRSSFTQIGADLGVLRAQIAAQFNLDELKTLCADTGIVHYEDLPGDTLTAKTRELIKYCHRYGRLKQLLNYCQDERANLSWAESMLSEAVLELPEEWEAPEQRWYALVNMFNRNRHQPFSSERTRQGDDIAFSMRELAPELFGVFDIRHWMKSSSQGKRLAAIKYLDWLQDVEFFGMLLMKLWSEGPFLQLHVLITLEGLVDQLDRKRQHLLRVCLIIYNRIRRDSGCEYWKQLIIVKLSR
jgi:hypothetical protein